MPGPSPICSCAGTRFPQTAEAIDVVVHLHGFSQQGGEMPLSEKVPRSGLDLTGRTRPTLALLPRGNWIREHLVRFPGAGSMAGSIALVAYGLDCCRPGLRLDRLILTGHSGGVMPALDVDRRCPASARRIAPVRRAVRPRPGAGRPVARPRDDRPLARRAHRRASPAGPARCASFISSGRPAPMSREVGDADRPAFGLCRSGARARYSRGAIGSSASLVPHGYVAWRCGPDLLADPGIDIDWPRPV